MSNCLNIASDLITIISLPLALYQYRKSLQERRYEHLSHRLKNLISFTQKSLEKFAIDKSKRDIRDETYKLEEYVDYFEVPKLKINRLIDNDENKELINKIKLLYKELQSLRSRLISIDDCNSDNLTTNKDVKEVNEFIRVTLRDLLGEKKKNEVKK